MFILLSCLYKKFIIYGNVQQFQGIYLDLNWLLFNIF